MMVVKTKGDARASGCVCLDTASDAHAQLLLHEWFMFCHGSSSMKKAPDGATHRWGRREKNKSHRRFERAAPNGGKWVVLCAPKSGVTFNEKGENKHNVEHLGSSKLSAGAEDCGVWWMAKEGKRSSKRQRGINYSHFPGACGSVRACTTLQLYFETPLKTKGWWSVCTYTFLDIKCMKWG